MTQNIFCASQSRHVCEILRLRNCVQIQLNKSNIYVFINNKQRLSQIGPVLRVKDVIEPHYKNSGFVGKTMPMHWLLSCTPRRPVYNWPSGTTLPGWGEVRWGEVSIFDGWKITSSNKDICTLLIKLYMFLNFFCIHSILRR